MVLVVDESTKEMSGMEDVRVAILNLFNYIGAKYNDRKALEHLCQLYEGLSEDGIPSVTDVIQHFEQNFSGEQVRPLNRAGLVE